MPPSPPPHPTAHRRNTLTPSHPTSPPFPSHSSSSSDGDGDADISDTELSLSSSILDSSHHLPRAPTSPSLVLPSLMDASYVLVEPSAPRSPGSEGSSEIDTEISSARGTMSALGSDSEDELNDGAAGGEQQDPPTPLIPQSTATGTPTPGLEGSKTSSSLWRSWTDPDKSSIESSVGTIKTPHPSPPRGTSSSSSRELARHPISNLGSSSAFDFGSVSASLASSDLVASHFIFPKPDGSPSSSTMTHVPSTTGFHIPPSLRDSLLASTTTGGSDTSSTTPFLPRPPTTRTPGAGLPQSFLADPPYATRIQRGDAHAAPAPLAVGVAGAPAGGAAGRVDQKWLEAIALARAGMGMGRGWGVGGGLESGFGELDGWESSYVPLEEEGVRGEGVEVVGVKEVGGGEEGQGTVNEAAGRLIKAREEIKDGLGRRLVRDLMAIGRLEHAKRFAILALPLIAMTLWATLSPVNPSSLFELQTPSLTQQPDSPILTELHIKPTSTCIAESTPTPAETVASSLSVMYRSGMIKVEPAPPKITTTSLSVVAEVKDPGITSSAASAMAATTNSLSVLPEPSDTALMPHPLAFMHSKFVKSENTGLHGRRMEKRGRKRRSMVHIREGAATKTLGPKRDRTGSRIRYGHNLTADMKTQTIITVPPSDPAGAAMQWFTQISAKLSWVANMILDSAMTWSTPLAYMRMELAHLARRMQQLVRDVMAHPGEAREKLLERMRKLKGAYRRSSWSAVRENVKGKAKLVKEEEMVSPAGEAFLAHQEQVAEALVESAWQELHSVFAQLDAQLERLLAQGDQAMHFAQRESKRTMKQARKGLDNVLKTTADVVERTTGVEIPLPQSVKDMREGGGGKVRSSKGEKLMQLFHNAALAIVI